VIGMWGMETSFILVWYTPTVTIRLCDFDIADVGGRPEGLGAPGRANDVRESPLSLLMFVNAPASPLYHSVFSRKEQGHVLEQLLACARDVLRSQVHYRPPAEWSPGSFWRS
jgi:hypothetical protein